MTEDDISWEKVKLTWASSRGGHDRRRHLLGESTGRRCHLEKYVKISKLLNLVLFLGWITVLNCGLNRIHLRCWVSILILKSEYGSNPDPDLITALPNFEKKSVIKNALFPLFLLKDTSTNKKLKVVNKFIGTKNEEGFELLFAHCGILSL